jgi:hypothetical protein
VQTLNKQQKRRAAYLRERNFCVAAGFSQVQPDPKKNGIREETLCAEAGGVLF